MGTCSAQERGHDVLGHLGLTVPLDDPLGQDRRSAPLERALTALQPQRAGGGVFWPGNVGYPAMAQPGQVLACQSPAAQVVIAH